MKSAILYTLEDGPNINVEAVFDNFWIYDEDVTIDEADYQDVLSRRLPIDPKEIINNEKFMQLINEHDDYVTVQITKQDIIDLDFYVMDMSNQRQDIINRYIAENKLAPNR